LKIVKLSPYARIRHHDTKKPVHFHYHPGVSVTFRSLRSLYTVSRNEMLLFAETAKRLVAFLRTCTMNNSKWGSWNSGNNILWKFG